MGGGVESTLDTNHSKRLVHNYCKREPEVVFRNLGIFNVCCVLATMCRCSLARWRPSIWHTRGTLPAHRQAHNAAAVSTPPLLYISGRGHLSRAVGDRVASLFPLRLVALVIGVDEDGEARILEGGAGVVWCE